jgi:hypothetical protein
VQSASKQKPGSRDPGIPLLAVRGS